MLPNVTPIQMSNWQLLSLSIPIDDPDDYQAQKLFEGKRKPTNCLTMLLRIQAVAPTTRKEFRKGNHDRKAKKLTSRCQLFFCHFNWRENPEEGTSLKKKKRELDKKSVEIPPSVIAALCICHSVEVLLKAWHGWWQVPLLFIGTAIKAFLHNLILMKNHFLFMVTD